MPVESASSKPTDSKTSHVIGGFQEVMLSVTHLEQYAKFFRDMGGWREFGSEKTSARLLALWGLPDTDSQELLLRHPARKNSFVRLIRFASEEQRLIRSFDQSWDTGGIFDINVRVENLHSMAAKLERRGWQSVNEPVEFHLGPFHVREWLVRGLDGVRFAMIERIAPPLENMPDLHKFSHIFNSTQIVKNIDSALSFYTERLGFKIYLEDHGSCAEAGPNVYGLPHNLAAKIKHHLYILHPQGGNDGSVELLSYEDATGADFSAHCHPPNRGILMLRFPVQNARAFAEQLQSEGVELEFVPTGLILPPYGECELFGLRTPEGAWLEFFSTKKPWWPGPPGPR